MALAPVIVSAVTEQRFVFGAPRLTRLKTFDASTRATHWRRQLGVRLQTLEEYPAAHLENAVAAAAAGDFAEVRAVHRGRWTAEVRQVEDVGSITAELELEPVMELDSANHRGVVIPVARNGERHGTFESEKVEGAGSGACYTRGRCSGDAICCRIEPLRHLGRTVSPEGGWSLAGDDAGTIVPLAVVVIIHAVCNGEGLAAVQEDGHTPRPAIQRGPDDPIIGAEVVGLPHHRSGDHVTPVLI